MADEWKPPTELPDLRHLSLVAIDSEERDDGLAANRGSGWPWHAGYVVGISAAWRTDGEVHSIYIPLRHPDSQNFDREQVARWLRDLFASGVNLVGHNLIFDLGWLHADLGVAVPAGSRLNDTGAAATLLNENLVSYRLEDLCQQRQLPGKNKAALMAGCEALGLVPASKSRKKSFKPEEHIWRLPARFVGAYAEQDPVSTLLLHEALAPELDREGLRAAYRVECGLLPLVHRMRAHGIRVDSNRAEEAHALLITKRDAVRAQLAEKLGVTAVSMTAIRSKEQLKEIFDAQGVKYPLTKKGNPSFKSGQMGWMSKSDHWLPQLVDNIRKYDNSGKFILNILKHVEHGRVHGEIHSHKTDAGGTKTTRFSYSHPGLQQTPSHNPELAPLIRQIFLPEEGQVWASCDISQQEFRLIVDRAVKYKLSGAAEMLQAYADNPRLDIHQAAADRSNGVLNRHGGKCLNFGKFYGVGLELFATMISMPVAEARKLYEAYDQAMPFVGQLAHLCKRAVWRYGHLQLLDGARQHFNLWTAGGKWKEGAGPCSREEAERRVHDPKHDWYGQRLFRAHSHKALNAAIQGSCARYTKAWMLKVAEAGITPLLQMHDSLDLSVSSPEQAEMVARLGEEVGKHFGLVIPMPIDVKFGHSWNDARHTWAELHAETDVHAEPAVESPSSLSAGLDAVLVAAAAEDITIDAENTGVPTDEGLLPWEGDARFEDATVADADLDAPEPPHVCIHCKLEPPDGTERRSAYDGAWMHERCELAFINARLGEEGIPQVGEHQAPQSLSASPSSPAQSASSPAQSPSPSSKSPPQQPSSPGGDGRGGNGAWQDRGSKAAGARDTYTDDHAGEPFSDSFLQRLGYRLTRAFDYALADGSVLYQQNRYELLKGIVVTRKRPRKRFLAHRMVNGTDTLGAGARRVVYNWPAVMRAGPGSTVFVAEGENKAEALIGAGLLATTVLSHGWTQECISALAGRHLIILADNDDDGKRLAADAQKRLAPVAASTRIVPAAHLWKHLDGGKDPELHDDVIDWIRLGGNPGRLLDICREIPADGIIVAEAYQFRAEEDIAPWEWLYGRHLLRGEVAGTAATGGTGKSTMSIVEALAMASGRALLGEQIPRPLRVVLVNLEDARNTMDKRIAAAMQHYKLTAADIGDRLTVIAKGEVKVKVAVQLRSGKIERNAATIRALTRLVIEHRADVLSIDSFVRTHQVSENDNSAMQEVVECFEDVAVEANCAVHLWHHTRKLGGEKATVEAIRGASAFVDACRSARVLEKMTTKEHEELLEIHPDMRPPGFYFRAFRGKLNFAPPADESDWYELGNVELANGDDVGVVTTWRYPASQTGVPVDLVKRIITELDRGMPNGQRFSNHNSATKRPAWPIVQRHCPDMTQAQCRRAVASWIRKGLLYEDEYPDPTRDGRQQTGLYARKEEHSDDDKDES
jgi:DNA polymerase I-like protein with 3'-5' exonuclease and polymerase domains